MSLATYVRASMPDLYNILGIPLRPFSLGAYLLMQRYNCGFSCETQTMGGMHDLVLGLSICAMTYEDFLIAITEDKIIVEDVDSKGKIIKKEMRYTDWLTSWGKQIKKQIKSDKDFNMFERFTTFENYMKEGMSIPKYWEHNQNEPHGESGSHWTQNVLLVLTGNLGYTQSEALNMPLAKGIADYLKFAELQGSLTLMTDDEVAMVEANAQKQKEKEMAIAI